MESLSATFPPRTPSKAEGSSRPATARSDIEPSSIDHETVLSPEEIQILRHRFASYNCHATRKTKSLSGAQAIKLFRDDCPGLSEWEVQEMFRKCDLNFDGQLSITEYLQARAYHRLAMEANTETEVFRSFTILDTDSDGIILADEVLALVEQSGLRTVGILKQAITQAAAATKHAEQQRHCRQQHTATAARRRHDGEITFEHFMQTIRLVNRIMEQEIAVKSLRVTSLNIDLVVDHHQHLSANLPDTSSPTLESKASSRRDLTDDVAFCRRQVDSKVTVDMKEFLCFARAFGILRSSEERDGEPYTPPPMTESPVIKPISLMELVREFYAAKLDVSFSNPARRDTTDLNFREFLRCILRISLAMHAHNPKKPDKNRASGIVSTTFEALKEEEGRAAERPRTPLYHRRGNVLGPSHTKICKMTSTSIISKLLRTSRAVISQRETRPAPNPQERADLSIGNNRGPLTNESARSPVRVVHSQKSPEKRKSTVMVGPGSPQFCPARPAIPQKARSRPVTSGGPPVIRLIRPPDT